MSDIIYLDHNSTTPLDQGVLEAMIPFFTDCFGNPSSSEHLHGNQALAAVKQARKEIAELVGVRSSEVFFTSGSTESNNAVVFGVAAGHGHPGHVVSVVTEHSSVLEPMRSLERRGWDVTLLPVGADGTLDAALLEKSIRPDTALISVMAANNETGVLHDLAEVAEVGSSRGIPVHSDMTQVFGHVAVDMSSRTPIAFASFSAHKIYGPKGVGVLVARRNARLPKLEPMLFGGGQQGGLRPGTVNTPGVVGMAAAMQLADRLRPSETVRLRELRNGLIAALTDGFPGLQLNGSMESRLPGNVNVWLPGVEARALCAQVRGVCSISSGSACHSDKTEPSHVLMGMGLGEERSFQSIRIGIGRGTTEEQLAVGAKAIVTEAQRLAALAR